MPQRRDLLRPRPPTQPTDPGGTVEPCPKTQRLGRPTVVSINIHGAVGRGNLYQIDEMAAGIAAWDADIVLRQEVHRYRLASGLDDQPVELAARPDMNVVFGRNFTEPPEAPGAPRREPGTAILSRLPILTCSNQLLPNQAGLQQRGLLRATIDVAGQQVDGQRGPKLEDPVGPLGDLQLRTRLV